MYVHLTLTKLHIQLMHNAVASDGDKCRSVVGKDTLNVKEQDKPTMVLSLNGHTHYIQESLVIHEFGHALGLEHEHQRSDFWDVLGKFLDTDKMKKSSRVSGPEASPEKAGVNNSQWFCKNIADGNVALSEYDPHSIMHYKWVTIGTHCVYHAQY